MSYTTDYRAERKQWLDVRAAHVLRGLLGLLVALAAGAVLVLVGPVEANAAGRGDLDVCVLKADLGKSWTRGLEKRANRAFDRRIDVHRIAEDDFGGCDAIVWSEGRVALDYVTGRPSANPRFYVLPAGYRTLGVEFNVGTSTPKRDRVPTMIAALRSAGVR